MCIVFVLGLSERFSIGVTDGQVAVYGNIKLTDKEYEKKL